MIDDTISLKEVENIMQNIEINSKCQCDVINRKVRRSIIQGLSELKQISKYKATKIYENKIEGVSEFHSCCAACCSCHMDRFAEEFHWNWGV